jgi:hypothetical protein
VKRWVDKGLVAVEESLLELQANQGRETKREVESHVQLKLGCPASYNHSAASQVIRSNSRFML